MLLYMPNSDFEVYLVILINAAHSILMCFLSSWSENLTPILDLIARQQILAHVDANRGGMAKFYLRGGKLKKGV